MRGDCATLSIQDAELVERCRQGDTAAFGLLVRKYQDRVFNTCLKMCGNRTDAEDLTQEAFVKALQAIDRFGGRSQFYTWLFRITVNLVLSARRKNKRSRTHSLDQNPGSPADQETAEAPISRLTSPDASPSDVAASHERERIILEAMATLDAEARTVVVLRDIESFGYDEIAEILEVPTGTVKSRLHRARLALRKKLTPLLGT